MEKSTEIPDMSDVIRQLIAMRNSLVNVSMTLRDLHANMDVDGQIQAERLVSETLKKYVKI